MQPLFEQLGKFGFPGLLLVVGVIFIFLSNYEVRDLSKLTVAELNETNQVVFWLGVSTIGAAAALSWLFERFRVESMQHLTRHAERKTGRRFANLVYIYAKDKQAIAMGLHKGLGVHLPPGGRLELYEMPHEKIIELVRDQISLDLQDSSRFVSPFTNSGFHFVTETSKDLGTI